jgi:nucleotide-binding universal stress UspA family protein
MSEITPAAAMDDVQQPLFRRASVLMSLTDSDVEVLQYASLLAGLGVSHEFCFVHVVTPAHATAEPLAVVEEKLAAQVRRYFGPPGVALEVSCHVRQGVRIDSLVEFVGEQASDLIILGHRKNRSGSRSLACRLAMVAPAAVWLAPQGAPCRITKVLAPIDFSQHSAEALSMATRIAQRRGLSDCLALHVFFDPSTIRYDEHLDEVRGREQQKFAEFLAPIPTHGVTVHPLFDESSNVAHAILRVARQRSVDLLVMNTRGRSQSASILLGSATQQTIKECETPILVVKNHGAHLTVFQALRDSRLWSPASPKTN